MEIDLGRLDGLVPQPQGDDCAVDAGVQEVHRGGVSQRVRRDFLVGQAWAIAGCGAGVLGDQKRDRVVAERPAAAGWEQWLVTLAGAFGEPFAQDGDGLPGQWGCSLFPSFPEDLNVRAGAEVHVMAAQTGEL